MTPTSDVPQDCAYFRTILICLRKYFCFKGRASLGEFWSWISFMILLSFIPLANKAAWLLLFIPTVSVFVRRLHDTGRPGWLLLGPLIGGVLIVFFGVLLDCNVDYRLATGIDLDDAFVGLWGGVIVSFITIPYVLVLTCLAGSPDDNQYGSKR